MLLPIAESGEIRTRTFEFDMIKRSPCGMGPPTWAALSAAVKTRTEPRRQTKSAGTQTEIGLLASLVALSPGSCRAAPPQSHAHAPPRSDPSSPGADGFATEPALWRWRDRCLAGPARFPPLRHHAARRDRCLVARSGRSGALRKSAPPQCAVRRHVRPTPSARSDRPILAPCRPDQYRRRSRACAGR